MVVYLANPTDLAAVAHKSGERTGIASVNLYHDLLPTDLVAAAYIAWQPIDGSQ